MIKKIDIPLYFGRLILIQKKELKDIPEKYKPKDFDVTGYAAFTYFKDRKSKVRDFYIAFNKKATRKIIAHESLHCVGFIFHHKLITYDYCNDEPAAYLLGWITEQCHKYLKVK